MTAQIHDRVRYLGNDYLLLGVRGHGLFDPAQHGLKVEMISTACYRGFHCAYSVEGDGTILLREVYLGLRRDQNLRGVTLFGRDPEAYSRIGMKLTDNGFEPHTWTPPERRLLELREPMAFDGNMLIGTGYLKGVRELTFRCGHLTDDVDGASIVDQILKRPISEGAEPFDQAAIDKWMERLALYGFKRLGEKPSLATLGAKETCSVEVVVAGGLPEGLSPFVAYVNGNIRNPRPGSKGDDLPDRRVLRLEPGSYRFVLRGRNVGDPLRIESDTLHFVLSEGERIQIKAHRNGETLMLTAVNDRSS